MNQPGFNFLSFVSDNLGKATHWKSLVRGAGNSMYFVVLGVLSPETSKSFVAIKMGRWSGLGRAV
jgi:hypothetical protein